MQITFYDAESRKPQPYVPVIVIPNDCAYWYSDAGKWQRRVGKYENQDLLEPVKKWAYFPEFEDEKHE